MTDLNDALCAYGVNLPEVMDRFVNDEALYFECLHSFIDDSSFAALAHSIRSKEYEAAFDCAHTLKGVAGNLGLAPLLAAITGIVEPLRKHDYSDLDR